MSSTRKQQASPIAIRDKNLFTKQWQCGLPVSTQSPSVIAKEAFSLFTRSYDWFHPIRSITVRAINLTSLDTPCQLDLFSDPVKVAKAESLDKTIEDLRYRFGKKIIRNACLLNNPKMSPHDNPDIIERRNSKGAFFIRNASSLNGLTSFIWVAQKRMPSPI